MDEAEKAWQAWCAERFPNMRPDSTMAIYVSQTKLDWLNGYHSRDTEVQSLKDENTRLREASQLVVRDNTAEDGGCYECGYSREHGHGIDCCIGTLRAALESLQPIKEEQA